MWRSPEMREGPHVRMMRLRMLLSRSCGSHVNSNFERMIGSYNLLCIHAYT